jgi:hypothetical protein
MPNPLTIVIKGEDDASGKLDRVRGAVDQLGGACEKGASKAGGLHGFLLRMSETAAGMLSANYFQRIADSITKMASESVAAIGEEQFMMLSYQAVMAEQSQWVTKDVAKRVALSQKEKDRLKDLYLQYEIMTYKLEEQKQAQIQLNQQWGEGGLAAKAHAAEMRKLESDYADLGTEIVKLEGVNQSGTTVMVQQTKKAMDWDAAMANAAAPARELYETMEKLGLLSPVSADVALEIGRVAGMAKLGVKETESFTQAWIRYGYYHRMTGDEMADSAQKLMRMMYTGEMDGRVLMTLSQRGINLATVLQSKLGKSIDAVQAKLKTTPGYAREVIKAFTEYADETAPSMAREMNNLSVLLGKFGEYARKIWEEAFGPLAEAALPYLYGAISKIAAFITGPELKAFAGKLASGFQTLMNRLKQSLDTGDWSYLASVVWDWVDIAANWAGGKLGKIASAAWNWLNKNVPNLLVAMSAWPDAAWEWVQTAAANVGPKLQGIITAAETWAKDNWPKFTTWATNTWDWVEDAKKQAPTQMEDLIRATKTAADAAWARVAAEATARETALRWQQATGLPQEPPQVAPGWWDTAFSEWLKSKKMFLEEMRWTGAQLYIAYTTVMGQLTVASNAVFGALVGAFDWGIAQLNPLFQRLEQTVSDGWRDLARYFTGGNLTEMGWGASGQRVPGVVGLLTDAVNSINLGTILGPFKTQWDSFWAGLLSGGGGEGKPLLGAGGAVIGTILPISPMAGILGFFNTDLPDAVGSLRGFWTATGAPLFYDIHMRLQSMYDMLAAYVKPAWDAVKLGIGAVSDLTRPFLTFLDETGNTALETLHTTVDGAGEGLQKMAEWGEKAYRWLADIVAKGAELPGALWALLGHSPSPVERGMIGIVNSFKSFRREFNVFVPARDWNQFTKPLAQMQKVLNWSMYRNGTINGEKVSEYLWGARLSRNSIGTNSIDAFVNAIRRSGIEGLNVVTDKAAELYETIDTIISQQPNAGEATHRAPMSSEEKKRRETEKTLRRLGGQGSSFNYIYDEGGVVPGPAGSHRVITVEAGEEIVPADERGGKQHDHWHLHIHTSAPAEPILADFFALQAMGRA